MQWLLLAFSFVIMAVLQRFARAGGVLASVEARATLSLGFLLFAAYLGGGIAQRSRLRVPRIVGYLGVGFLVGSGWLGLIRSDEAQALSPIATGALSLIALAAACQLDVRYLALRVARRGTMLRRMDGEKSNSLALV